MVRATHPCDKRVSEWTATDGATSDHWTFSLVPGTLVGARVQNEHAAVRRQARVPGKSLHRPFQHRRPGCSKAGPTGSSADTKCLLTSSVLRL